MFIQPDKTIINIGHAPQGVKGWLVSDDLAQKITAAYPYFDFVLNDDGVLIDINPIARPDIAVPESVPSESERLDALEQAMLAVMEG